MAHKMVMKTRMSMDDMFHLMEEFDCLDDEMNKALPYLHDDVKDDNLDFNVTDGVLNESDYQD